METFDKTVLKKKAAIVIFEFLKMKSLGSKDWFIYDKTKMSDETGYSKYYVNCSLDTLKHKMYIETKFEGVPRKIYFKMLK
jgi:hypothetical protein